MPSYQCARCHKTLSAAQTVRSAYVQDVADVRNSLLGEFIQAALDPDYRLHVPSESGRLSRLTALGHASPPGVPLLRRASAFANRRGRSGQKAGRLAGR